MNVKEIQDRAIALHAKKYNCAQSVACAFSNVIGMDESLLFKFSEGYGLGMGDSKECCGAITAGMMILSLLKSSGTIDNPTKKETFKLTMELRDEFEDKYNSTICNVLKSNDPDDKYKFCDFFISDCIAIVCKIIERECLLSN